MLGRRGSVPTDCLGRLRRTRRESRSLAERPSHFERVGWFEPRIDSAVASSELHTGAALVLPKPAALDAEVEPGLVFGRSEEGQR